MLTTPASAAASNHSITLGEIIAGFPYPVEIDGPGCTTKNLVEDAGTLGILQMIRHSCNPNCKVVPVHKNSGIELLALEALRDIAKDEEVTIDYDAQAFHTSKQPGLTFWQMRPPTLPLKKGGLCRIECGYAGKGRKCPNRLWRDEPSSGRA